MPTSVEDFSLWLAAVCPLPEAEKVAVLKSTDTAGRIQRCIHGLQTYINQINSRRSVLSAASDTVSGASSAIAEIVAALTGRRDYVVVEEHVAGNDSVNSDPHSNDNVSTDPRGSNDLRPSDNPTSNSSAHHVERAE